MIIQTQLLAASYSEKLNLRVCVYRMPVAARQPVSEAIMLAANRPDENAGTAAVDLEQPRCTLDRSRPGLFLRALERHVRRRQKCAQRLKAEIDLIRILRPALRD